MKRCKTFFVCGTALCLALTVALTGCASGAGAAASGAASSVQSAASGSGADSDSTSVGGASASSVTAMQMEHPEALVYDDIRLVVQMGTNPAALLETDGAVRYYTMKKDGKWGVLRADGTEVLPCLAPTPVLYCPASHWSWNAPLSWEKIDEWNEKLAKSGDGETGCAHGFTSGYFAVVPTDSSVPRVLLYTSSESGANVIDAPTQMFEQQGGLLPVAICMWKQNEMAGIKTPEMTGGWNFADEKGKTLASEAWDAVGWFDGEALAPVCRDGKWAYVDATGKAVTEYVYEAAWTQERQTVVYPLCDGFAPVKRGGLWGVMDSKGKEIVPCEYDSAVPANGGVLLQKEGAWEFKALL